jgi:predicted nuclease with TOPRIM domain
MTERDLLELKQKVETAKTTVSEKKGEKTALLKQLKSYNCSSIEEGNKKVKDFDKEITKLNDQIETNVTELEKYFEE